MNPESRQIIHMGINFVVSPPPAIDRQIVLSFLQYLNTHGIDFDRFEIDDDREVAVICETPARLEIKVVTAGAPAVGQLLVVSPQPSGVLEMFVRQVEATIQAFDSTWPAKRRQLISCDATIRDLYETSEEHAFMELWESRLGQSSETLAILDGPVLGGGLRFVIPPQDDTGPLREIKIESFLRNTKKIFVETQFKWTQPTSPGEPLEARNRLEQIDAYIKEKVVAFILGRAEDIGGD